MANNLKQIDGQQVLRSVWDPDTNRLRVDAELNATIGSVECIIDQVDDSIRIGDGTDLVTTTTQGSDVGLDVNIINSNSNPISVDFVGVATPTIANINVANANSEYNYALSSSTKSFSIKSRNNTKIQLAFTSGQTDVNYITIPMGCTYVGDNLTLNNSLTLYFELPVAGDTVEITSWS